MGSDVQESNEGELIYTSGGGDDCSARSDDDNENMGCFDRTLKEIRAGRNWLVSATAETRRNHENNS